MDKFEIRHLDGAFNGLLNQWKGLPYCLLCSRILWYVITEEEQVDPDIYFALLQYHDVKIQRVTFAYVHRKCLIKRFGELLNGCVQQESKRS